MRKAEERGRRLVKPSLVKGILSIAMAKNYSIEDLAEEINVNPTLIEVCLLLANLTKSGSNSSSADLLKKFDRLLMSPSFKKFCKVLNLNHQFLYNILSVVFNFVTFKDISDLLISLNLHDYVDVEVMQALMAVARSFLHRDIYDKKALAQAESIRDEVNEDL